MRCTVPAAPTPAYYTPPEFAAEIRVSPEKIIYWILAGELKASNVATRATGGRPRYRIAAADAAAFLRRRSGEAEPKVARGRSRKPAGEYREYV